MSLDEALQTRLRGKVVVVGVGNPLRGDDAAGSLLARQLVAAPGLLVIDAEEVPENVVGEVAAACPDTVVFVDAADFGGEPGSIAVVESDHAEAISATTHRLPLGITMRYVAARTGADVFLLGVQPGQRTFGAPPSAEVADSVGALTSLLAALASRPRDAEAGLERRQPPAGPEQRCGLGVTTERAPR